MFGGQNQQNNVQQNKRHVARPHLHDKERCKKKTVFLGLCPKLWVGGGPKLFSENNHSVIFTANIQKCPKTCNT